MARVHKTFAECVQKSSHGQQESGLQRGGRPSPGRSEAWRARLVGTEQLHPEQRVERRRRGHTRAQLWECDDDESKCKEVTALPGKPRATLKAGAIKELGGTEAAAETVGLPQSVDSRRVRRLTQAETPKCPVAPVLHRLGCQARQTSGLL